jgi:hypothetical protein
MTPCMTSVVRRLKILEANITSPESNTLLQWYQEPAWRGKGSRSLRPLNSTSKNPSGMSVLGVPYSPIVPILTRWASGQASFMA